MPEAKHSLLRALALTDACALVGTVIGTGVFLKTALMTQQPSSPTLVLPAWLVINTIRTNLVDSVIGLALIALGLPVYFYFKRKQVHTHAAIFPAGSGQMTSKEAEA